MKNHLLVYIRHPKSNIDLTGSSYTFISPLTSLKTPQGGSNSMYRHLKEAWKSPAKSYIQDLMRQRVIHWRRQPTVTRVDKPTRLDRAHRLGYKAKKGIIVVRVRVRRGGARKLRPILGRRQKRMGVTKFTPAKSIKLIAEQRAARKFPNLEVLNSYWVWQDGISKWYEIIMLDPSSPYIKSDKNLGWISKK